MGVVQNYEAIHSTSLSHRCHMKSKLFVSCFTLSCCTAAFGSDSSPTSSTEPTQLPHAMHTPMKAQPRVVVGMASGDIVGADNRALQAAVDYVASLGGGLVEIGPGEYLMR